MAFNKARLRKSNAGDAFASDGTVKNTWLYMPDPDTLSDVQAANYFNAVSSELTPGDLITVAPNLTDGLEIETFVISTIVGGVVGIELFPVLGSANTPNFVIGSDTPGIPVVFALEYDNITPPTLTFDANYLIKSVYIVQEAAHTGVMTMFVEFSLTGAYAIFNLPATLARDIRLPDAIGVDTYVSKDEVATWSAADPSLIGKGRIFIELLKVS